VIYMINCDLDLPSVGIQGILIQDLDGKDIWDAQDNGFFVGVREDTHLSEKIRLSSNLIVTCCF